MAFGGTRVTPLDPLAVYPAVPETQLAEVRSDADVSPRERALAPIDADVLGLGHLPAGVNAAAEKTTATRHRWRVVETTTTPDPAVLDDTFASLVRDVRDVLDTTLHTRDVFRGLSTALSEVEVLPSPSEINTPLCARHVRFVETFPVFDLDSQKRTPVWDFEMKTWTRDTFPGLHPRAREDVFALERWLESSVGDAVNGDENESDENDANDENDVNDADAKADDANFKSHENTKARLREAVAAHDFAFATLAKHVAVECKDRAGLMLRVYRHIKTLLKLRTEMDIAPDMARAVFQKNKATENLKEQKRENEKLIETVEELKHQLFELTKAHEKKLAGSFAKCQSLASKLLSVTIDDVDARTVSALAFGRENELREALRVSKLTRDAEKTKAVVSRWVVLCGGVSRNALTRSHRKNHTELATRIKDGNAVEEVLRVLTFECALDAATAEIDRANREARCNSAKTRKLRQDLLTAEKSSKAAQTTFCQSNKEATEKATKLQTELTETAGHRDDARFAARELRGSNKTLTEKLAKANAAVGALTDEALALRKVKTEAVEKTQALRKQADSLDLQCTTTCEALARRDEVLTNATVCAKKRERGFKNLVAEILRTGALEDSGDAEGNDGGNDSGETDPCVLHGAFSSDSVEFTSRSRALLTVDSRLVRVSEKAAELLKSLRRERDELRSQNASLTTQLFVSKRDASESATGAARLKDLLKESDTKRETLDIKQRALGYRLGKRDAELRLNADVISTLTESNAALTASLATTRDDAAALRDSVVEKEREVTSTNLKLEKTHNALAGTTCELLLAHVERDSLEVTLRETTTELTAERSVKEMREENEKNLTKHLGALRRELLLVRNARNALAVECVALDLRNQTVVGERNTASATRDDAIDVCDSLRAALSKNRRLRELEILRHSIATEREKAKALELEKKHIEAIHDTVADTCRSAIETHQTTIETVADLRVEIQKQKEDVALAKKLAVEGVATRRAKKQARKEASTQCDDKHAQCGHAVMGRTN